MIPDRFFFLNVLDRCFLLMLRLSNAHASHIMTCCCAQLELWYAATRVLYLTYTGLVNRIMCHSSGLCLSSATKKRMQTVANISIMAMFIMYLLTALFGYLTFFGKTLFTSRTLF